MIRDEDVIARIREADPAIDRDFSQTAPSDVLESILARTAGRRMRRKVLVVATVLAGIATASLGGIYGYTSHDSSTPRVKIPAGGSADPGVVTPSATPVSLSDAAAVLGQPVVLPNTSLMTPSDAGAVTEDCSASGPKATCVVHVNFPAQGITVSYSAMTYADPLSVYKGDAAASSNGTTVAYLSGIPALVIPQNPNDPSGTASWIEFVANRMTISIVGHYAPSPLEDVAQSIIARLPSASQ